MVHPPDPTPSTADCHINKFVTSLCFAALLAAVQCAPLPLMAAEAPARVSFRVARGAAELKSPVRDIVLSVQRELHSTLSIPPPTDGACEIVVEIGFKASFDKGARHTLFRLPSGAIRAVIVVPGLDDDDIPELRFAAAAAVFRSTLHARAAKGDNVTEPPEWLVRGMAALADRPRNGLLFEEAYNAWSHASLDEARALFSRDSRRSDRDSVASQLVAWCAERPESQEAWDALLDALAGGEAWSAGLVARIFGGFDDAADLDRDFDSWMDARSRRVFSPGLTFPGVLARTRLLLVVFPHEASGFDGEPLLPLSFYVHRPETEGARELLLGRAKRFRLAAIGRDAEFRHLCKLYAEALEASALRGWPAASSLWLEAERESAALDARAAAGEILGIKNEEKRGIDL